VQSDRRKQRLSFARRRRRRHLMRDVSHALRTFLRLGDRCKIDERFDHVPYQPFRHYGAKVPLDDLMLANRGNAPRGVIVLCDYQSGTLLNRNPLGP